MSQPSRSAGEDEVVYNGRVLTPRVVERYFAGILSDGPRVVKLFQTRPLHPAVKRVLTREPHDHEEAMSMARCMLYWCMYCGASKKVTSSFISCPRCNFAYYCNEECRRMGKKYHADVCMPLRKLHDAMLPAIKNGGSRRPRTYWEKVHVFVESCRWVFALAFVAVVFWSYAVTTGAQHDEDIDMQERPTGNYLMHGGEDHGDF